MGRRSSSQGCIATGNQGAGCSRQPRPPGLPLNPLECGIFAPVSVCGWEGGATTPFALPIRRRLLCYAALLAHLLYRLCPPLHHLPLRAGARENALWEDSHRAVPAWRRDVLSATVRKVSR